MFIILVVERSALTDAKEEEITQKLYASLNYAVSYRREHFPNSSVLVSQGGMCEQNA
jgi:site-specific recombinase